jgi:hypothetical protein
MRPRRILVFVGAREVAGLLFGLFLLRSHAIELRFVEHEPDSVVPPQIVVPGEDRANPFLQVFRNLDAGLFFFVSGVLLVGGVPFVVELLLISSNLSRSRSLR